uniref:SoHo domain-containing protein n=1 Tax=Timema cristinae TaxID=61476 RepID=A0A7R9GWC1_TIMCR|nr:unnamed protein product [Timema cristinae]
MNSSDGNKGYTNPNEILYTVNKEYEVERDGDSRKKVVDPTPRKYEGIGPTTRDGVPIVLRSEIKDMNQAKWYKRMYDSLHRAGTDGHYPYTSAGGYLSEPDHHGYDSDIGFAAKYATLDRRRIKNKENDFTTNTLPRSKYVPHPNSIKHATEVYKNQPGRIEDYMPGRSSISEKETKQWLDTHSSHPNYRSIFSDYDIYHRWYYRTASGTTELPVVLQNCQWYYRTACGITELPVVLQNCLWYYRTACGITELPVVLQNYLWYYRSACGITELPVVLQNYLLYYRTTCGITELPVQEANERRTTPSTPSGKSFMTHALKESGYESDSTLVFKRRDENLQNQLSPAQHKIAYNTIQKGGEVPLHGLRKPAPERPKEISEIEYFPISPHLTRIRVHKQNITPLREILCYPVTTHVTNPPPIFSTYKRTAPSYIHVSPSRVTHRRPPPPPRISSHNNSTLRLWSGVKVPSQTHIGTPRNRHESCHTPTASDANIRFLRERLSHKLGVAPKESNRITRRGAQEITNPKRPTRTLSSSPVPSSWSYSTTSSPTAMFRSRSTPVELPSGRRTKVDTTTALRSRRAQQDATSARLSRSPDLYSPSQARRTFQKTQEDKDTKQRPGSRSLPPGTVIKSSTTLYSSARNSPSRRGRPEEKSLRVTVAISAKGRELLRSGAASTSRTNISKSPTLSPTGFRQSVSPKSHTPLSATSKVRTKTSTSPVSTNITKRPCRSVSRESSCSDHVGMSKTSKHNPSSILYLVSDEGNRRIKRSDIIESRKRLKDKSSTSEEKPQSSLTGIKPALKKSFSSISSSIKGALKEDKLSTDTFSKKNKKNRSESNGGKSYGNSPGKKNGPTSKTTGKSRNGVNGGSEKRKSRNEKKISGDPVSRTTTFTNLSAMPLNEANLNQFGNFEDPHTTNNQFGSFENLSTVNRTQEQPSPLKSDSFFQHLLLRGMPSPTPSVSSSICRTSSVLEKARRFYEQANVSSANKIPYKSEPYLGLINVYLAQKRPVTESKFRSLDRDKRVASRSPSPSRLHSRRILPFISRSNIKEDNESVRSLVSSRSRTPESIKFTMKHRSSSEPPIYPSNVTSRCQSPTKDVIQKPLVKTAPEILESPRTRSPSTSPSPIRSPACRKIRSARVQTAKTVESIIGVKKKPVLRAKSAGDVEEVKQLRKKLLRTPPPSQAQSTSSLNLSHITDHGEYQSYVMELFHSTKKSERFKDLHKFYASLERMGQLERTTSIGDLRPRLKGEEIIDYDRWKQLRTKEKAEEELKVLYSRLKEAQKERDFLFRPHDAESLRWKGECDRGLRCREKSVEDLRQQFHKFSVEDSELEATRRRELEAKKDVYKPLWRGSSVLDLATSLTTTKASHRGRAVTADSRDSRQTVLLTRPPPPSARDLCRGIGSRLWSSLSMDQVNALKNQLSEIYSSVSNIPKDRPVHEQDIRDQFEIAVTSRKETSPKKYYEEDKDNLHVRCNSLLTRDQLYSPLVRRREARRTESLKADSISSLPHWKRSATKTIEDITIPESERLASPIAKPLSESEKKRLSLTLSQEVLDRVTNKGKKPILSLVGAKETRGAIAAEAPLNSRRKSPTSSASPVLSDTVSPRTCYSLEMSEEDGSSDRQTTASTSLAHRGKNNFLLVLTPSGDTQSQQNEMQKAVEEWANSKPYSTVKTKSSESGALVKTVESDVRSNVNGKSSVNGVLARLVRTTSTSETESASSETSTKTVIHRGSKEEVQQKVYFFERRDEEAEQDKRWARGRVCCSASDVRYSHHPATAYATRAKSAPSSFATSGTTIEKSLVYEREKPSTTSTLCPSQSYSDFKELFGEKHRMRYATAPLSSRSKRLESVSPVRSSPLPIESSERKEDVDYRALSQGSVSPFRTHYSSSSTESLFHQRSRSASPDPTKYWRAYLRMVKRGDVRRLRDKFESLENLYYWTYFDRKKEKVPPKRYRSDPELARNFLSRRDTDAHRVVVRGQEVGDVRWLRRRYESSGSRGRSRIRKGRVASPVLKTPLRAEDRFMPHINVISKLATLQQRSSTVPCRRRTTDLPEGDDGFTHYHRGEVGRICDKFEHLSLLGQMFTSTPDVRELRDIAPYLGCQWVAHKYPDNSKDPHSRSLSSPELRRSPRIPSPPSKTKRPASSSPTRRRHQQPSSILKSQQSPRSGYDVFANQQFDPSIHRPLYRYQPAVQSTPTSWWVRQGAYGYTGPSSRPTVTFKEPVIGPVPRDYHSKDRPSVAPSYPSTPPSDITESEEIWTVAPSYPSTSPSDITESE